MSTNSKHLLNTAFLSLLLTGTSFAATTIFTDGFDGGGNPANVLASGAKPTGTWYQQDTDDTASNPNTTFHWSTEEHLASGSTDSTLFDDFDALGDADNEFRIGFGFDEVRILYNTGTTFDLTQNYTFSGSWEIWSVLDNPLGFIAGIAEFDATTGALVQTIGFDPGAGTVASANIFGDTSGSRVAGDTGIFSITATAAILSSAGVTTGNHVGVYFHHDDDGVLGSDVTGFTPNVSDVYIVDDVSLTSIPEPSASSLLGFAGALLLRRRRH